MERYLRYTGAGCRETATLDVFEAPPTSVQTQFPPYIVLSSHGGWCGLGAKIYPQEHKISDLYDEQTLMRLLERAHGTPNSC